MTLFRRSWLRGDLRVGDITRCDHLDPCKAALAGEVGAGWGAQSTALALSAAPPRLRRIVDALLHLPAAIPSVVGGLGLLVAFSRPPLLLNGTRWIVLIAPVMLVVAFAYSTVAAALDRQFPSYAQVAASLGAPGRCWCCGGSGCPCCIRHVRGRALAIALSMGEVGATVTVYPPDWRTCPSPSSR